MSDRVLGGVCSGLGRYFNIDPTIVRLVFCIAFFIFGTGLLAYIILWIAMPVHNESHDTATEEMADDSSKALTPYNSKGSMTLGITLIAIGALMTLGIYFPKFSLREIWPIAIIAIGIVMIINALKRKEL
mgnify:CR=1 FL=1